MRESRTIHRWTAWKSGVAVALRQLDWARPVTVAAALHLPFVIGLLGDRTPDWLDTAWAVSATLVGFGVALVIFLLQAAGSQSLSREATYRALLAHTGLIWAATLALAFVISVAVLERYGAARGQPSAWADTWALVVFVIQVAAFGVTFGRTLSVVSPSGVARVLREAFADAMRAGIESSLLRRVMVVDLHELTKDSVAVKPGFWARGRPVLPTRPGLLVDVDRRLPSALARMKLEQRVTLALDPGRPVGADEPLATLEGARGAWLERMIRQGVVVSAIEPVTSPLDVFHDVLDVARRALAGHSQSNFHAAMQLTTDCLAGLPDAYEQWGFSYSLENVAEPFVQGPEDQILDALFRFNDEVFRSGEPEAVMLMPHIATALVQAGRTKRAGLLVSQATGLWRHQLETTRTVRDAELERRIHDLIGRFGAQEVLAQQYGLEDEDRPLDRRLAARDGLVLLFRHQMLVMKYYLDQTTFDRFVDAWQQWVEWAKHWTPEHEVDDLELQARFSSGQQRREIERELKSARALLEAKQALETQRASLAFALGTWALERVQRGKLETDKWLSFLPYLAGMAASNARSAAHRLGSIYFDPEIEQVERWQLSDWDGKVGWQPADTRLRAQQWGVLVLLRTVAPDTEPPEIELGPNAAWQGPEIVAGLTHLASEPDKWEPVVGGRLADRVKVARAAVEEAVKREEERAAQRLADAPLDEEKLASYATQQRKTYTEGDYLRQKLLQANAVDSEESADAFSQAGYGRVLPKRPFTAIEGPEPLIDVEQPAKALVLQQLRSTYAALAALAPAVDGDGAEAAVHAVEQLRTTGHEPDVMLMPQDAFLRPLLSTHAEWKWNHDPGQGKPLAYLSGVPVYDAGPGEATALVVCKLGAALRRVERRPPGDDSPVRVEVALIDQQRADKLLDAGYRAHGLDVDDRAAQERELIGAGVEVHVDMDVQWLPPSDGAIAALRVELPPADERRQARRRRQGE